MPSVANRNTIQPGAVARVKRWHPLAKHLRYAFVPNMARLTDVLHPHVAPTLLGTGTAVRTQSSAGAVQRVATESLSFPTKTVPGSFAVVLLAMRTVSPNSAAEINKIGTLFGVQRVGNANFSIDMGNLYGSANTLYIGGYGLTISQWVNGVDYSATGFTALVNDRWFGIAVNVTGFGGAGGIYFAKDPAFWRGGGLYQLMGGAIACCFVFNKPLTKMAAQSLSSNPQQLLHWPSAEKKHMLMVPSSASAWFPQPVSFGL